jgi:orotate phosphoribosyltransferase
MINKLQTHVLSAESAPPRNTQSHCGTNIARADLGRRLVEAAHLSGKFLLRSGAYSDDYFDKYRFAADPDLLVAVAGEMAGLLPADAEIVAGIELGGVVLATALSIRSNKPAAFIRKERKPYGTQNIIEGAPVKGKTVSVIEDVISTGGQVVVSVNELRAAGAKVATVLCVIDRSDGKHEKLRDNGLELRAVFTRSELDLCHNGTNAVR